jgi:predicted  nucleic acid-binding Zn ribbon protein
MYTAEINFKLKRGASRDDAESAMWSFMASLCRNGQLIDRDDSIVPTADGYKALVGLPERGSLRRSLFSKRVREYLSEMQQAGLRLGSVRILGEDLDSFRLCRCRKNSGFILQTAHLTREMPLECADCNGVVPLYRIPHTGEHGDYGDIRYWVGRYRTLDDLWTDSGVGEQFAYRQLSRHDSDLSKLGRAVCRRIEKNTGIATYYYLYHWYTRSPAAERRRTCPSCGRKWLQELPWMGRYEFRCGRCRLVSNFGQDVS